VEEISLRELVEILVRGRRTIALITIMAVLVAGVASFFVVDPSYEARAIVMVNQAQPAPPEQGTPEFLTSLTRLPQMTIATYVAQVKNPVILRRVIEDYDLTDKYTVAQLAAKVSVNTPKDTNLMEIKVQDKDPKLAADIANSLAAELVSFVSATNQQRVQASARVLKNQIDSEEKSMSQGADELKAWLQEPRSVTELQADLDAGLELLKELKGEVVTARLELETARAGLRAAEKALNDIPPTIKTRKALADDAYLSQVVGSKSGQTPTTIGSIQMESEEVNDAYMALLQETAVRSAEVAGYESKVKAAETALAQVRQEVQDVQVVLVDKQLQYEQLQQKLDTARQNYALYNAKYAEALSASSLSAGEANLILLSQAFIPRSPVAPRKLLNMAVAGVLGLMVSVFIVFFQAYWRSSAPGTLVQK
jgi:succinoglycan biosynthesis transport protein ExoP